MHFKRNCILIGVFLAAIFASAMLYTEVRAATEYTIKETFMTVVGGIFNVTPTAETDGHPGSAQIDKYRRFEMGAQIAADSFTLNNAAAVNATATATKAADTAGRSHYCKSLQASVWQDATGTASTATGFTVEIIDGAPDTGTVKWSQTISFPVGATSTCFTVNGNFDPPIKGTANTVLTVRWRGPVLLHTGNTVNAQGFTR